MNRTALALLLAAPLLLSCRDRSAPGADDTSGGLERTAPADTASFVFRPTAGVGGFRVVLAPTAEIDFDGNPAATLRDQPGKEGKHRWVRADGTPAYEVKDGDDAFKLRDPSGALLWKVKAKDDGRIKLSDDEEGTRPLTLRVQGGRVEAEDEKRTLGSAAGGTVQDAAGSKIADAVFPRPTAAAALQLASRVPAEPRAVLAAELLLRGR